MPAGTSSWGECPRLRLICCISTIGREIWKIIAIAALILFFLEGLLARWVSKSRKAGEEVRVDFEKRNDVPEEFMRSVAETKGGAR